MSNLQTVVQALNDLGIEAKSAFIVWVVFVYTVKPLAVLAGIVAFLMVIPRLIKWCVTANFEHERAMRDALGLKQT